MIKFKLRHVLFLGFGTILALSLAVNVTYVERKLEPQLTNDQIIQQNTLTRYIAENLSVTMAERSREIEQFGRLFLSQHIDQDPERLRREIDSLKTSFPYYSWIGYADESGSVVAASNDLLLGKSVVMRPWFKKGLLATYIGDVHDAALLASLLPSDDDAPLRFIDFSTPVYDADGQLRGVFAAHASFRWAETLINDVLQLGQLSGLDVFVMNSEGVIHYPRGTSDDSRSFLPSLGIDEGVMHWSRQNYHYSATRVALIPGQNFHWLIVTRRPTDIIVAPAHDFTRVLILVALGTLALAMLVAGLAIARINLAFSHIKKVATDLALGQPTEGARFVSRLEELSELDRSMQRVSQQISAQRIAITSLNENLEQRVHERTEMLKRVNEDLQGSYRKSGEIYAMVAHELRTPVSAISMLSDDPQSWSEYREQVRSLVSQLMMTLDDMRLAINPALNRPIRLAQIHLRELVEDIEFMVRPVVKATEMEFDIEWSSPAYADETLWQLDIYRLKVAISNLVKNACLHSGGTQVVLAIGLEGGVLSLCVRDNGKGIAPDKVERLYNAFTRGDSDADGTGMGLNIVKVWMEEIGATVNYRALSPGSEFSIRVPLDLAQQNPEEPNAPKDNFDLLDRSVVLVDDDAMLRMVGEIFLKTYFTRVQVCSSATEALDLLQDTDLLITDFFMPEMDGVTLAKTARARGFAGVIVALTGAFLESEHSKLKAAGADMVLEKPLTANAISMIVEHGVLRRS